jgi:hypothetical protein
MLFSRVELGILAKMCQGRIRSAAWNAYGVRKYLDVMRSFIDGLAPLDMVLKHVIIHYEGLLSR